MLKLIEKLNKPIFNYYKYKKLCENSKTISFENLLYYSIFKSFKTNLPKIKIYEIKNSKYNLKSIQELVNLKCLNKDY